MDYFKRTFSAIVALISLVIAFPGHGWAHFYPNDGNLYYNGYRFADSCMKWSNPGDPGPWSVSNPGYEHDLILLDTYVDDCTTWTNLPDGYDDCPTAGIQDTPPYTAFSFGSFDAEQIQPNTWYYGSWSFSGGTGPYTTVSLKGQEVHHEFCPFDLVGCMNGVQSSPPLVSGLFIWGLPGLANW